MEKIKTAIYFAIIILASSSALPGAAQNFSTMTIVNSSVPGGGTDAQSRLVTRHLSRYMPGSPNIIVRNMPGAGGLIVASYLYNVAPRDGSTFGLFSDAIAFAPLVQSTKIDFEPQKFFWIGSLTSYTPLFFVRSDSRIKKFGQVLKEEVTVGASGAGSVSSVYPTVLNKLINSKFKVINGYRGSANINLAIERGEVEGYAAWCWSCIKINKPDWVTGKQISIILQLSFDGDPELNSQGIQTLADFIDSPGDRRIANIVFGGSAMARPFALPPGVPETTALAIRSAFEKMAFDTEFLEDAKKMGEEINFVTSNKIRQIIDDAYSADAHDLARLRSMIETEK